MEDADESKYPQVNAIVDPLYLLIKVPGTNKFRFLYGINIQQDIDDTSEQPRVIVPPMDALNVQDVDIPYIGNFDAKLKLNKDSTKTRFTTKTATTVMGLAKIIFLP